MTTSTICNCQTQVSQWHWLDDPKVASQIATDHGSHAHHLKTWTTWAFSLFYGCFGCKSYTLLIQLLCQPFAPAPKNINTWSGGWPSNSHDIMALKQRFLLILNCNTLGQLNILCMHIGVSLLDHTHMTTRHVSKISCIDNFQHVLNYQIQFTIIYLTHKSTHLPWVPQSLNYQIMSPVCVAHIGSCKTDVNWVKLAWRIEQCTCRCLARKERLPNSLLWSLKIASLKVIASAWRSMSYFFNEYPWRLRSMLPGLTSWCLLTWAWTNSVCLLRPLSISYRPLLNLHNEVLCDCLWCLARNFRRSQCMQLMLLKDAGWPEWQPYLRKRDACPLSRDLKALSVQRTVLHQRCSSIFNSVNSISYA